MGKKPNRESKCELRKVQRKLSAYLDGELMPRRIKSLPAICISVRGVMELKELGGVTPAEKLPNTIHC
jgi:hypothetical protein